jgi:DNA polymerase I-like protein with 3'-5' exonuclease and polymerase domains
MSDTASIAQPKAIGRRVLAKATPMKKYTGIRKGKYFCVQTMPQFHLFMAELQQQSVIAVDTETSGLDWVKSNACGIVVGWGVENNYYLPIDHKEIIDEEVVRSTEKQLDLDAIRSDLCDVLEDESVTKVFWNAKFDLHFLRKAGIEVKGVIHDGVILVHLLDENSEKGLKPLSKKYLGKTADKWEVALHKWRIDESRRRRKEFSSMLNDFLKEKRKELEAEFFTERPFIKFSGLCGCRCTLHVAFV